MEAERSDAAAGVIWEAWCAHALIDALPEACRPRTIAEGYAAQGALARLSGGRPIGWKIAATSAAGQTHIGVDGPLAGRLLESKLHRTGATLPAGHLHMAVAEAEFVFRIGEDLPGKSSDYTVEEVMTAVAALHVAIEIPDSRFSDFTTVGAAQLIADNACTEYFVLGSEALEGWRAIDLITHPVGLSINGTTVVEGTGANVLGDPRLALTWLANDRVRHGGPLAAGEMVTTGTCVTPAPIRPGDHVAADFAVLGTVDVTLAS